MSSTAEDGGEQHECPTCGRDDFASEQGMKLHHTMVHGESIAGIEIVCEVCGKTERKRAEAAESTRNFCSTDCRDIWLQSRSGEQHPDYNRVEVVCDGCGVVEKVTPSRAELSERYFCKRRCYATWISDSGIWSGENHPRWVGGPKEVECLYCDATLIRRNCRVETQEWFFCNDTDCESKWKSENVRGEAHPHYQPPVEVECSYCGGILTRPSSYMEKYTRFFCTDKNCQGKWLSENNVGEAHWQWEGGVFPYGFGWNDAKKELIRERDGRKCRVCGKSEAGHLEERGEKHLVHHIVKARVLRDSPAELRNGPFNLVSMCREHHRHWERVPPLLQFMAFLPHPSLPTEQATFADLAADD